VPCLFSSPQVLSCLCHIRLMPGQDKSINARVIAIAIAIVAFAVIFAFKLLGR